MSKHTPGPWSLIMGIGDDGWSAIDAESNLVVEEITNRRDADLVVSAPEMYEALKGVLVLHSMESFSGEHLAKYLNPVFKAIAKAEGRS